MAQLKFTDSRGQTWLVWSTVPTPGAVLATDMQQGWLTFESTGERRRLAPIPRGWEDAAPDRLELYCRAAQAAQRSTPAPGISQPPSPEH